MSDELETVGGIAAHVVGPLGGGGLGAWLMHFFKSSREERERKERAEADKTLAVRLEAMTQKLDQLISDVREHKQVFEDVVTTKNAIKTIGEKLDDLRAAETTLAARVTALEVRRRR